MNLKEEIENLLDTYGISSLNGFSGIPDNLLKTIKSWALEIVGEDEELPMPSMSNPQYPYTRGINATKQEIRQRIEESTKADEFDVTAYSNSEFPNITKEAA